MDSDGIPHPYSRDTATLIYRITHPFGNTYGDGYAYDDAIVDRYIQPEPDCVAIRTALAPRPAD